MTGKTHLSCGIAISLAVVQPNAPKEIAICISAATIGSLLPDIDVASSKSRKELNKIIIISIVTIMFCTLLEAFFHVGIIEMIEKQSGLLQILCGLTCFLAISCFGFTTPHRSFMHSILCLIATSGIIWIIFHII